MKGAARDESGIQAIQDPWAAFLLRELRCYALVGTENMRTLALAAILLVPISSMSANSTCYGTPSSGRLENGVQLAKSGPNFEPYSSLGVAAGRTYVHSKVADVVLDVYSALARSTPEVKYVYGESG